MFHHQLTDSCDYVKFQDLPGGVTEIVDIAVGTERGVGKGRYLVEMVKIGAKQRGQLLVFARTRASNFIAQEFYTAIGFRLLGVLDRFYLDTGEDAYSYGIDL